MEESSRPRKIILAAAFLFAIGAVWIWQREPARRSTIKNPISTALPSAAATIPPAALPLPHAPTPRVNQSTPVDRPHFASSAVAPAQQRAAEADPQLRVVAASLREYRLAFRQNPVGSNVEITRVLLGKNPRGLRYLPADVHLNPRNELTDRWDQPIFFHQISGAILEVRSAGADHIMWNDDDEVLR